MSILMGFSVSFINGIGNPINEDIPKEVFSINAAAVAYILFSLLFQYFIYEVRNPNEYYFYYNLGLNKYILWGSTFMLSSIIAIISILI